MQSSYSSKRSAAKRVGLITEATQKKGLRMLSRIAATVMLSIIVFIVVTLFMGLGVLWWTGDSTRGVLIGVICGTVAAFTVSTVGTAIGRSGGRSRDEQERSGHEHKR
jgi:hypothetical protein